MTDIADQYCGQVQPHPAHTWSKPPAIDGMMLYRTVLQCAGLSAHLAPIQAILDAWDAWDGSLGPDGQTHPDASSPRDRERLRAALSESRTKIFGSGA